MQSGSDTQRLVSVDFWRGVCLLMIFINHIPGNPLSLVTLRNWGFADAAEIFVFLAGFSAVLAFRRYFEQGGFLCGTLKVAKRTWQLFCAHVLLIFAMSTIVVAAGSFTDSKLIIEQLNFSPFFVETDTAILQLVKLQYMPSMTDILPIYIVFIAAFPLIWWLLKRSPLAVLGLSFAIWMFANITGFTLANYPAGRTWFLNPLAWQMMFVMGACSAVLRQRLGYWLQLQWVRYISVIFVLFSMLAAAPWVHYPPLAEYRIVPPDFLVWDDKSNLSLLRVVHFWALLVLAQMALPAASPFWRTKFAAMMMRTGRHALPVYCAGIVLSLSAHIFLHIWSGDVGAMFVIDATGIVLLCGLATGMDRAKQILTLKGQGYHPPLHAEEKAA